MILTSLWSKSSTHKNIGMWYLVAYKQKIGLGDILLTTSVFNSFNINVWHKHVTKLPQSSVTKAQTETGVWLPILHNMTLVKVKIIFSLVCNYFPCFSVS